MKTAKGETEEMAEKTEKTFTFAALTVSDTGASGERAEDLSGDVLVEMMSAAGFVQAGRRIVPDERGDISRQIAEWCDSGEIDVLITTGGTGLGPRDVTPEATRDVLDLEAPGIAEAMRSETLKNTPFAMLSRAAVGARNGCLVVNLPGSPTGVRETLEVALRAIPHALEMMRGWRTHANP